LSHEAAQDVEEEIETEKSYLFNCPHCHVRGPFAVRDPDGTLRFQNCGGNIN